MWVLFGSFFMFSNFYPLDLEIATCVGLENLGGSMSTNQTENGPPLIQYWLFTVFVDFSTKNTWVELPIVFIVECGVVHSMRT